MGKADRGRISFFCRCNCHWLAQSRIGTAGAGTIAEKPETAGVLIIMEAIPETMTILGFVVAAIIMLM